MPTKIRGDVINWPISDLEKSEERKGLDESIDNIKRHDSLNSILKKLGLPKKKSEVEHQKKDQPLVGIITGSVNITNYYQLYVGGQQSLSTIDDSRDMMKAINRLEARVEENKIILDKIRSEVAVLSNVKLRRAKKEKVYIYFNTRDEFVRAVHCLQDNNIQPSILGGGGLVVPTSAKVILKTNGLEFGIANNLLEFYGDKERIENYRKQVEEYYGN